MQETYSIEGGIKKKDLEVYGDEEKPSSHSFTNTVPFQSWWSINEEKQDLFGHSI